MYMKKWLASLFTTQRKTDWDTNCIEMTMENKVILFDTKLYGDEQGNYNKQQAV